ncbi:MAG: response regulator transcription factor [Anaerolineaceae bacterium]|nr:response regulator transcription factor [Anaerolineaceae bacterium]
MSATILVVDDQSNVRQLLQEYLTTQGFRVITATDGQEALFTARHQRPDLVLLDIMMPKMNGFQFLHVFRQECHIPVIIVTAREEETDAVTGLDLGADDYVTKPFRMRELTARINAILRRFDETPDTGRVFRSGTLVLDQTRHTMTAGGVPVALTPIEFDRLAILMRSPGQVFTRTQLVEHLGGSGFSGLDRTLNVHIRNLRTKIEIDPGSPQLIETVFGVGYRLHENP